MKLVSIIIPVYNSEKYIDRCINSIVNQTYKDIEIILIDDGSSDRSIDIINNYVNKDNRIKVYTQKNAGPSSARNYGLDVSTGDYVMFVDADDYIDKTMVEEMINRIIFSNTIVFCNNKEVYINRIEERKLFNDFNESINKDIVIEEIANGKAGLVCCKLFNKDIVDKYNIKFETDVTMCEDQIFFLNVVKYCDRFIHIQKSLYYYDRCNEVSISQKYQKNAINNQIKVLKHIESFLKQSNIDKDKVEKIIKNRFMDSIIYCIGNEISNSRLLKLKTNIRNLEMIINNHEFKSNINNIEPSSFREKIILDSFKNNECIKMYYIFYFLDNIINPVRFKLKGVLKR